MRDAGGGRRGGRAQLQEAAGGGGWVEEGGRRGARGGRRWELRSGEGRPGAGRRVGGAASGVAGGRRGERRRGCRTERGRGPEGKRGILGILGRRRFFRFWAFAEGPDPGPSAKMFLFFLKKNSLPSAPGPALGKDSLCRVPSWHSANFQFFFCFFYPKFFVGPAYIVYNFMFKFGAFSSFFVIFG